MTAIDNDTTFKQALEALTADEKRRIASRFAEAVLDLCDDFRVRQAVAAAAAESPPAAELAVAYQGARAASVETYTACGHDTEWLCQAGHFVAAAAAATAQPDGADPWRAAMCARMARTCEMIAQGVGGTHSEAERQYELVGQVRAGRGA
jgi:hypothetical protein